MNIFSAKIFFQSESHNANVGACVNVIFSSERKQKSTIFNTLKIDQKAKRLRYIYDIRRAEL